MEEKGSGHLSRSDDEAYFAIYDRWNKGSDFGHCDVVIQKQNGLRGAVNEVRPYCRPLPAELPEWERVANQEVPILYRVER